MAFLDDPDIPDYRLRLLDDGGVEISGGFKHGLSRDLKELLNVKPDVRYVRLSSYGGRMGEAEQVYDLIDALNVPTYVRDECTSACVIAFAAGTERWIDKTGDMGLHSPNFPGMSPGELHEMSEDYADILVGAGFDPAFVKRGTETSHDNMWYPMIHELFAGGAVTGVAAEGQFSQDVGQLFLGETAAVGSQDERAKIESLLIGEHEYYRILRAEFPTEFQALMDSLESKDFLNLRESTMARILESDMVDFRRRYARHLLHAPDQSLQAILQAMIELHEDALARFGADFCNKLAWEGATVLAPYSEYAEVIDRAAITTLEATASAVNAPVERDLASDDDWLLLAQIMSESGLPDRYFDILADNVNDSPDYCPALIAMMNAARDVPGEAGERIRGTFLGET